MLLRVLGVFLGLRYTVSSPAAPGPLVACLPTIISTPPPLCHPFSLRSPSSSPHSQSSLASRKNDLHAGGEQNFAVSTPLLSWVQLSVDCATFSSTPGAYLPNTEQIDLPPCRGG
ncbi:unnamed protein product [Pleuronectes platessa]|uniref:Secreted protein n=1 Tax=Pleuronectes platessa TaxID=8262 RepID=A0A9N7VG39_PLEPL|nr:unnamed protein product [Pleuronectes platessa]